MATVEDAVAVSIDDAGAVGLHLHITQAAAHLGQIADIVKKAYRNVHPVYNHTGVLDAAARKALLHAKDQLSDDLAQLEGVLRVWQEGTHSVHLPYTELSFGVKSKVEAEMGDVSWYVNQTLSEANIRASSAAARVLAKLADRKQAGTIRSTGDDEATRAKGAEQEQPAPPVQKYRYTEEGGAAIVELVADRSDDKCVRMDIRVVKPLQPTSMGAEFTVGEVFELSYQHGYDWPGRGKLVPIEDVP